MAGTTRFKRTQFIVDRTYQLRFVFRLIGVIFSVVLLSLVLGSALIWFQLDSISTDTPVYAFIDSVATIALALSIQVVVALPIVYFFGIRHTHRVVGPLVRIKRTLKAIGEGDFSQRIHLRKGDVLMDLAAAINEMAETLEKKYPSEPKS